eukprot:2355825-Prymnesium_polylepis.1
MKLAEVLSSTKIEQLNDANARQLFTPPPLCCQPRQERHRQPRHELHQRPRRAQRRHQVGLRRASAWPSAVPGGDGIGSLAAQALGWRGAPGRGRTMSRGRVRRANYRDDFVHAFLPASGVLKCEGALHVPP